MRVLLTFLTLLLIFVHTRAPYKWPGHPRRARIQPEKANLFIKVYLVNSYVVDVVVAHRARRAALSQVTAIDRAQILYICGICGGVV